MLWEWSGERDAQKINFKVATGDKNEKRGKADEGELPAQNEAKDARADET